MRTRRFDFNFKPLRIIKSFVVEGSVPGRQYIDGGGEHTPDFSITPLHLALYAARQDKDEILQNGSINHLLTNVKAYRIKNGVKTDVTSGVAGYTVTTSGENAGHVLVSENSTVNAPITVLVEADYLDGRTNQVIHINQSYLIRCDAAVNESEVELDAAATSIYNPFADPDMVTITPTLRVNGLTDTAPNGFIWEKQREDGSWSSVGSDDFADYDMTVNDDDSLTLNRRLMGDSTSIRCSAIFRDLVDGVSTARVCDKPAIVTFVRRLPKFEFDYGGLPLNIPAGTLSVFPTAKVWTTNGTIEKPDRELHLIWYTATNKASGSLSYTQIQHGETPEIPTKAMSDTYGMVLALDVTDAGPEAAWLDSDGSYLIDSDGSLIIIK